MPEAAGGESTMTTDITGEGESEFGVIEFDEEGTYEYTVSEIAGDNSDCEYDDTVYKVTAIVTADEDGKLQVERQYYKDDSGDWEEIETATFTFVNEYTSEEPVPEPEPEPEPEPVPYTETGDDSNLIGALFTLLMAVAGLGGVYYTRRRKDN